MKPVFVVCGYGIPKNILLDENYKTYLTVVVNTIYDLSVKNAFSPTIIFSGGKTDLFPPYRRSEADEMIRFVKNFSQNKPAIKKQRWKLLAERQSLSTLENFVFTKKILQQKKVQFGTLVIFCEQTRVERVKKTAQKLFATKIKIISVDFDASANRYLDPAFLKSKENAVWQRSLQALQSEEALREHHKLFQQKFTYLRQAKSPNDAAKIEEWWKQAMFKRDF